MMNSSRTQTMCIILTLGLLFASGCRNLSAKRIDDSVDGGKDSVQAHDVEGVRDVAQVDSPTNADANLDLASKTCDPACHAQGYCDTSGAYPTCRCNTGFTGDGVSCSDVDECGNGTHNCNAKASCTNTEGSFSCSCNEDYVGDGKDCVLCTTWDFTAKALCAPGGNNCDCSSGCGSTNCAEFFLYDPKSPVVGGTVIVLCAFVPRMSSCALNGVAMTRNAQQDNGRDVWVLVGHSNVSGTIICHEGNNTHAYLVVGSAGIQFGSCYP